MKPNPIPNHEIEVIAKKGELVYKIINISRSDYDKMERKSGFSYQPFSVGFSAYENAVIIDYKNNK